MLLNLDRNHDIVRALSLLPACVPYDGHLIPSHLRERWMPCASITNTTTPLGRDLANSSASGEMQMHYSCMMQTLQTPAIQSLFRSHSPEPLPSTGSALTVALEGTAHWLIGDLLIHHLNHHLNVSTESRPDFPPLHRLTAPSD